MNVYMSHYLDKPQMIKFFVMQHTPCKPNLGTFKTAGFLFQRNDEPLCAKAVILNTNMSVF